MPESELVLLPRRPIAIVRLDDLSAAVDIARALADGGITALEYTLSNRAAFAAVERVRAAVGDSLRVGLGTVVNADDARQAIESGAEFLVTPTLEPEVIAVAQGAGVPIACGAFTPTEILAAWRHGAQLVKVFPARSLGPAYIKDVLAPLSGLRLVPTGGVDLDNCAAFLQAGAYTVALGSNLVESRLVRDRDWPALAARARRYVDACAAV